MKSHPADIRELTALRFFAAAWVPPAHFPPFFLPVQYHDPFGVIAGPIVSIWARGYLGVDFFFALSGFVLTHVYLRAWQEGTYRPLSFLWARLARIYPMHLATMIAMILMLHFSIRSHLYVVVSQLTLTHAWHTLPSLFYLNFPSWSISAEWFAYLVFPFFAVVTGVGRKFPLAFLLIVAGSACALAYYGPLRLGRPLSHIHFDYGVLRIVPSFLVGCALYVVSERFTLPLLFVRLGLLAAAAGTLALCVALAPDGVMVLLLWALIFFAAQRSKHQTAPSFLRMAPLVYLGEISYSIYMVHVPFFTFWALQVQHWQIHSVMPGWVPWIVYALVFPLAAATYRWIEMPSRRVLRQAAQRDWRIALRRRAAQGILMLRENPKQLIAKLRLRKT